jgi:murein DD-endopeptidase MepM/ murein hydrolase activator NlpD
MERRLPLLVLLAVVLLTAAPAVGDPGDDPGTDKAQVDAQLGAAQDRLDDVRAQRDVLTSELSSLTGRLRDAQDAVVVEQAKLDTLETALASQQAQRRLLDAELDRLVGRLEVRRHEEAVAVARLEHRLRQIYMSDDPDLLAVVLGAKSFDELLDNIDLLSRIGRDDERIADAATSARVRTAKATTRMRVARGKALAAERRIAARTAEQRTVRDRLAASRDAVAAAESAKQDALGSIRATEAQVAHEVETLQAESAVLAAKIRAASSGSGSSGSVSSSGLIWPVSGPVTSGFGMRWGRMHEGIDIAVPSGTPVGAAAAGTVIYAGWLGGYGNLVVVDHGGGLSTAYGHNSSLAVSVGQQVGQGQVIAYSGSTGHSTGPHVHFEVRVNGTAVDPLGYL